MHRQMFLKQHKLPNDKVKVDIILPRAHTNWMLARFFFFLEQRVKDKYLVCAIMTQCILRQ